MAKITVTCPKCSARYSVEDTHAGKTGQCGKCSASFVLESRTAEVADGATRTLESGEREALRNGPLRRAAEEEAAGIWNVGDVILDVYEVRHLDRGDGKPKHYAEGGMGVVYRVHHRGWDLDLAVKSPKAECFQTEQGKRDFERECKTWIELGLHPNIVSCYYVRRVDGIPRVFAEFVEGGSLEDWIQNGTLYEGNPAEAVTRILDIALQFAWGLDFAHEQGLIHQDVKPGNVMMQGVVPKVTDFGLAKAQMAATRFSPDLTQASMAVSWGGMTPAYCSPEQVQAAVEAESGIPNAERTKLTRRTDVWSWALTVFAMFYGKSPCRYGGQTAADVFKTYRERRPEDRALPDMPDALADLVQRCFQGNPEARPQTMQEVAEDLKRVYQEVAGGVYPRQEPVTTELMANSLNNRAASLLDLGKQEEAVQLLEEARQRHPWQPQVTHNRGLVSWRMGQITDADLVTELEELSKTRPQDWEAAYSLGLVQLERGR
ncbi:MAG: protein kinase [Planctomycetota bacterium]